MKELKNHKLLIDKDCPMCRAYGGAFESFNYVEKGTCLPYQEANQYFDGTVDSVKARNQIALIDTANGTVIYGIEALGKILSKQFRLIEFLLSFSFVKVPLEYLYKFISQNRKVIAPSRINSSNCMPDLDLKYRLLYITFVALSSAFVIFNFTLGINEKMAWGGSLWRELAVCFGQIAWQAFFFGNYLKEKKWEYLGNLSTVSLIGTLLLLPGFFVGVELRIVWFCLIVAFMTFEHIRRSNLLEISLWTTISWLAYRGLVMLLILLF